MKCLLLIPVIFLLSVATNAQSLHNIRFVYAGQEEKPIGTLSIAVEKIVRPYNRWTDTVFGKAVQTDINSYHLLVNYVKGSKYLDPGFGKIRNNDSMYLISIIEDNKEQKHFIVKNDFYLFFSSLKLLLKDKCLDENLIKAFEYY